MTPVNDAPVAANDTATVAEDTVLTVSAPGVLGNDSDIDSTALTAVLVASPSHGTLTLNSNGSFTYTPTANYNGADSFTFKANDGALDSNVATVSITITPVNDVPVAANESYSTPEERALNVGTPGALGNDTDVDGDSLTAVLVSGPAHGALTLNANGSFTYTPAAAYNGPDSFTYRARDPSGALSNAATVSLTVTPPTLIINNVSANEGNLLQMPSFTFTVSLSSSTSRTITVNFATADGTATAGLALLGGDYNSTSGTLTHGRADQQDGRRDRQRRYHGRAQRRSLSTCPTREHPDCRQPGPGDHPQRRTAASCMSTAGRGATRICNHSHKTH